MNPPFTIVNCINRLSQVFPTRFSRALNQSGRWTFEIFPVPAKGDYLKVGETEPAGSIVIDRDLLKASGKTDNQLWDRFEDEIRGLQRDFADNPTTVEEAADIERELLSVSAPEQLSSKTLQLPPGFSKTSELREKALLMAIQELSIPTAFLDGSTNALERARLFEAYLSGQDEHLQRTGLGVPQPAGDRPEEILDVLEGLLKGPSDELLARVYAAILERGGQVDKKLSPEALRDVTAPRIMKDRPQA